MQRMYDKQGGGGKELGRGGGEGYENIRTKDNVI
jgi:hypothetical protein